jgi:hypothetical protein
MEHISESSLPSEELNNVNSLAINKLEASIFKLNRNVVKDFVVSRGTEKQLTYDLAKNFEHDAEVESRLNDNFKHDAEIESKLNKNIACVDKLEESIFKLNRNVVKDFVVSRGTEKQLTHDLAKNFEHDAEVESRLNDNFKHDAEIESRLNDNFKHDAELEIRLQNLEREVMELKALVSSLTK